MKFNRTNALLATALLATTLMVTACAKVPQDQLTAAQAALDNARTAEAERYAPEVWRAASDSLAAANAEIQAQASKFALFRKYDRTNALIAASSTAAAKASQDAVVNKEAAKNAANEALATAVAMVDSAKVVLASAPVGKDNRADVEMMKADLTGAETNLEQVRTAITNADYFGARSQAEAITAKSNEIINSVAMAREKMMGGRR
ncbi:MAG: hypothetical protein SGI90_01930 [Candidatus Eisenbacteria bacterium]|nr:hypothetical protein [Candidatus Eisenbacteria bacterium]